VTYLVTYATTYPWIAKPLAVYIVCLLVIYVGSQSFSTFFRNDVLKMGNQLSIIGLGILVAAAFDQKSNLSTLLQKGTMGAALVVYLFVFLGFYMVSFKLYQYTQVNRFPGLFGVDSVRWLAALVGSYVLGGLSISLESGVV